MTNLTELLARVEAAEGADRELDALLFIAFEWPDYRLQVSCDLFPDQVKVGRIQEPEPTVTDPRFPFRGQGWREAPPYSASLDAAVALVERMLPGWFWGVNGPDDVNEPDATKRCLASVWNPMIDAEAATPALALLAALLKALIAKGDA